MILKDHINEQHFTKLRMLITRETGIKMPEDKRSMLQARLRKRARILKLDSVNKYCEYLFSNEGQKLETAFLIDAVSTNKTSFFREPKHFSYLENKVLPTITSTNNNLKIWSAGCSSGEEAYTIAMCLEEFVRKNQFNLLYSIMGTDISNEMVEKAKTGIYKLSDRQDIPDELLKRYFLKSKDPQKKLIRIIPAIRKKTVFSQLNLLRNQYFDQKFDIIFCRNTLIYFNPETQEQVVKNILNHLKRGGYLFIGHSESLFHLKLPLKSVQPTVYVKTA